MDRARTDDREYADHRLQRPRTSARGSHPRSQAPRSHHPAERVRGGRAVNLDGHQHWPRCWLPFELEPRAATLEMLARRSDRGSFQEDVCDARLRARALGRLWVFRRQLSSGHLQLHKPRSKHHDPSPHSTELVTSRSSHDAHHGHGGIHPDRLDLLLPCLSRHGRWALDRAYANEPARWAGRVPVLRQRVRLFSCLLPRLLRDRIHRCPAACTGRCEARHRSHLVRRTAVREYADELHAPPLWVRALLPARDCPEGGEELRHLLGRNPLGDYAADPGRDRDLVAGIGDLLARWPNEARRTRGRAETARARRTRSRIARAAEFRLGAAKA